MKTKLILSCEHASNKIPDKYRKYFADEAGLLKSHQGYDIGALKIFNQLKNETSAYAVCGKWSRLLIDLNRSLTHPNCFSVISRKFTEAMKVDIINHYYQPYRDEIFSLIRGHIKNGFRVMHISVHSFTYILNNKIRHADVGLLYDPDRRLEVNFCKEWKAVMKLKQPDLHVRFNYPYKGISDGLCTSLRGMFNKGQYAGIELEVNQNILKKSGLLNSIYGSGLRELV